MKAKLRLAIFLATSLLPNVLKKFVYRAFFGAKIGADVRIGFGSVLCFEEMVIDSGCRIGWFNFVRVHDLRFGKRCRVGSFTKISCHAIDLGSASTIGSRVDILADHRDPRARFTAGSESWIFEYCYINPARPITLGRNVGVGGGSYLFSHGYWLSRLDGYPVSYGPIDIGDDVWLPWGCFIMPGVSIGSGAVVGARSLVTKSLPAGALAAGSPAKVVRENVAVMPTLEQKNEILLTTTKEFAEFTGRTLVVEETAEWFVCALDGEPLMTLARSEAPATYPRAGASALCLVHQPYSAVAESHPRAYSLRSYQCCAFDDIGPVQKEWLRHLRQIGVRHYPIDEVNVEAAK